MVEPRPYRIGCPKCGKALMPVALGPDTAPWLCADCARGFFTVELTEEARAQYRPDKDDWGHGTPATTLRSKVTDEWVKAQVRGSSLRHDQLDLVDKDTLSRLADAPVHPDFAAAVKGELAGRL